MSRTINWPWCFSALHMTGPEVLPVRKPYGALLEARVCFVARGAWAASGLLLISEEETDRLAPAKNRHSGSGNALYRLVSDVSGRMLRRSRPIAYRAARRAIGPAVLDAWALSVNDATGAPDQRLDLRNDRSASFHRSRYDVLPCVYIVHMRIRYIFI
jgi:hypothetical protein